MNSELQPAAGSALTAPLLQVRDLTVCFRTHRGSVPAVSDISFELCAGETLGIVGESGSGKSITGSAIMGLLPEAAHITNGDIVFDGIDLARLSERDFRRLRGAQIATIFQDPMSGLNPLLPTGEQIAEVFSSHMHLPRKEIAARAIELLSRVGIADAGAAASRYPHELSGGMRQRVMIAMAIALRPRLIIADEPTTALDPTIQAQILDLMKQLIAETGAALILISHDFGVIAEMADRVAVMQGGHIVEEAPLLPLLQAQSHPYTRHLIQCMSELSDEQTSDA